MWFARRSLQIIAFLCTLLVGVTSMAVIVSQTSWFRDWLRGFIVRQAEDYVNGQLTIGRLSGNLFYGIELGDVAITTNGKPVISLRQAGLDYNVFSMFSGGGVVLNNIRLDQPVIHLEQTPQGWNLTQLIKAQTPDPDEPKNRRPITIGEIGISDGTLHLDNVMVAGVDVPARVERLDASVSVSSDAEELKVGLTHISLRTVDPDFGLNAMSGVIRRTENRIILENVAVRTEETSLSVAGTLENIEGGALSLDVKASSDKLALNEIAKLVPALRGYELQPALEVSAAGPLERLALKVDVREGSIGSLNGDLTVDAATPGQRVSGDVTVEGFNVGPLARSATLKSDITGRAKFDISLPEGQLPLSGTYDVNASHVGIAGYDARDIVASGRVDGDRIRFDGRASAYGGRATARGTVTTGDPLAFDIEGSAAGLDLRNLPPALEVPRVATNLQVAAYKVSGRGPRISGTVRLNESTLAGATIAAGTAAEFTVGAGAPQYGVHGQVSNVDLQEIGRAFNIPALAADRFRGRLNTTIDVTGSGGGQFPLAIDASGTATESTLFGATFPQLTYTANLAGGNAHVLANGAFANLDPATASGNDQVKGSLNGTLDVEATVRDYAAGVTADSIDVAGRIDLTPSTLADFTIDQATIDGRYANREGELRQLAITGPDMRVTGQGPIALNDTGTSNLTLHAETPSLARFERFIGQSLRGGVALDATVNGNGRELVAYGALTGSNLGQGDNGALSTYASFDAVLPELDTKRLTAHGNVAATFVQVAGQEINEAFVDATYGNSQLFFSAIAKQEQRELEAGGRATLYADHQEIHLPDLSLRSGTVEWRTVPGAEATVNYAANRITVDNLQLASGDQRITADGVVGSETETLVVGIANVDVSQVNQLTLGDPQQIAGRLNASATIAGPTDALRVDGEFSLNQGAFQAFRFDSLGGSVDYSPRGIDLDIRLQQTPTAWLTAKGFAPLTLLRGAAPGTSRQHQTAAAGEEINIAVASSEIELAVLQGFTTAISNVTGTVQANFTVVGSGLDPHLNGNVQVKNGGFEVPDLGTSYTGLDTRIDLSPEVITISQMRIVDNHDSALTIGGEIAVHEREVGSVNVTLKSTDFKVIDNVLGDLRLDTDLRLTGTIRQPTIEGKVDVTTGVLNVADILARATASAYSTTATELPTEDTASAEERVRHNGDIPAEANSREFASGASTAPNLSTVAEETAANREAPSTVPPSGGLFDVVTLNISSRVPDDLVLRGRDIRAGAGGVSLGDMNLTVGGDLYITKSPGDAVRITGQVNTVRGNYTFQGRRFDISRGGQVLFIGTDEIDPILNLEASRDISGVQAFVRVRGTVKQPELSFSSNPPLEEADVLSLIIFNQPINELGEGQQASLAQRAGSLASGYLASGLTRSIGSALNLNEFELQAAGENGAGPSVTIGQQVGRDLFFRLRQGFGSSSATEFVLEYQLSSLLRLQATAAQVAGANERIQFRRVERGGLDLIFFFAY